MSRKDKGSALVAQSEGPSDLLFCQLVQGLSLCAVENLAFGCAELCPSLGTPVRSRSGTVCLNPDGHREWWERRPLRDDWEPARWHIVRPLGAVLCVCCCPSETNL